MFVAEARYIAVEKTPSLRNDLLRKLEKAWGSIGLEKKLVQASQPAEAGEDLMPFFEPTRRFACGAGGVFIINRDDRGT